MRRSQWLGAATSCWLLLGACGDQPPAKSPRGLGSHPAVSHPSEALGDGENDLVPVAETPENPGQTAALEPAQASRDASATSEQLSERYGKTRALARQQGSASYYGDAFAGRKTASGAPYEPQGFTAAHRTLAFGTVLRVTRADGGQSVYVRVTDRGPYGPRGRILDLSHAAAEQLGMLRAGVVKIKVEVVAYGPPKPAARHRRRH
ncbi:MAG TPA: septal ring lytic transglycosylase RlpA family protein [Polyangiaceae bacterium]|nr:septal ring lytic transglycosylase RlpA family protein [Polyangiaceae bacterium]